LTALGSCVSACLHDPETGAGGMNHFMLPESELGVATVSARYGSFAMEVLINQLMKLGAARHRLQAKVFGGGSVLRPASSLNVAVRNVDFVRSYLAAEGVPIAAEDLGGDFTRVIHYFPRSGRALIKRLRSGVLGRDIAAERAYSARLVREPVDGNIELFD
jgi:chemotaxis protein CheD